MTFRSMIQLQFDFRNHPYSFRDPVHICQTHEMDRVIACLAEVENWVQRGYYAAGFVSYEAASAFRPYLVTHPAGALPLIWFGIFREPFASQDRESHAKNKAAALDLMSLDWQPDSTWKEYQTAIQTIRNHIAAGDSYQVNHTLRMQTDFPYDPSRFYQHMLGAQRSDYGAYLDIGDFQILSASPELFLEVKKRHITARPMKGTAPRGLTWEQDEQNRLILDSEKNRAENLMIVDLLRNDLGQVAQQGTVKVTSLYDKEKYPTVWQLTSRIEAELQEDISLVDLFRATFPCGSITGAPKASTMQIITQLEKQPRGIYCGALGVITPQREAVFSVPIRTLTVHQGKATYGVGGGITWDSTSQDEYDEILHKIQVLYDCRMPEQLLEALLLEEGTYFLLDLHLQRLKDSAAYFGFSYDAAVIMEKLNHCARQTPQGSWKVRLMLDAEGTIQVESAAIQPLVSDLMVRWASVPMKRSNVFLYHKTSTRDFFPKAGLDHEFLLFNEDDEVTEFVNGNFLLYKDGKWITPPVSSGLLNGTLRQSLIRQGKIHEAVIRKQDIGKGCEMAFINSVRKWRKVCWQEG